jgi:hypothetical protein
VAYQGERRTSRIPRRLGDQHFQQVRMCVRLSLSRLVPPANRLKPAGDCMIQGSRRCQEFRAQDRKVSAPAAAVLRSCGLAVFRFSKFANLQVCNLPIFLSYHLYLPSFPASHRPIRNSEMTRGPNGETVAEGSDRRRPRLLHRNQNCVIRWWCVASIRLFRRPWLPPHPKPGYLFSVLNIPDACILHVDAGQDTDHRREGKGCRSRRLPGIRDQAS